MPNWNWKVWPIIPPPSAARGFDLHVFVHELVGLRAEAPRLVHGGGLVVQLEWRGNRKRAQVYVKGPKRSCTSSKPDIHAGGVASWNEGFAHVCKLKESTSGPGRPEFRSWMLHVELHALNFRFSGAAIVLGKAQIDVAKFACEKGRTLGIPIKCNVNGVFVVTELTVTVELFDHDPRRDDDHAGLATGLLRARTLHPRPQSAQVIGDDVFSSTQRRPFLSMLLNGRKFVSQRFNFRSRRGDCDSEEEEEAPDPNRSSLFGRTRGDSSEDMLASTSISSVESPTQVVLHQRRTADGVNNVGDMVARTNSLRVLLRQPEVFQARMIDGGEIGDWESRSVVSRDGRMKMVADVFFASIDQCSEKADGGGACAVLVAVIADWLLKNKKRLPTRAQLDELIREGSSEWRKLCEDDGNRARFSDQHFDLETVLEAKVRMISTATTYVSFFSLEKVPEGLEHLRETMSFDSMWERNIATNKSMGAGEERIYITSWNDHFFILKVERDAIYLIDTLGERLQEGCSYAYIIKFDGKSVIYRLEEEEEEEEEEEVGRAEELRHVLCQGLGTCKEFIKGFLAALPLRELRHDVERGFSGQVHVHRRLQIEFHHTIASQLS